MALVRKLDEEELALLEIIEDPIWLAEFLRSTADGSLQKEEWPKKPFTYRWYQRDLISDRSPFISLVAGRAVGKCNPNFSRIYTTEGYLTIKEIRAQKRTKAFTVYALNEENKFVQRRAKLTYNGRRPVFKLTTKTGHIFYGTKNHPILTERGYVELQNLEAGRDYIAVATKLPWESTQTALSWFELRWLGYHCGGWKRHPNSPLKLKYQKQIAELTAIAENFDMGVKNSAEGYRLTHKSGIFQSFTTVLLNELSLANTDVNGMRKLPELLMKESLDRIKIFIESLFGLYSEITTTDVSITFWAKPITEQIQEILLRFGIETKIVKTPANGATPASYTLSLYQYRDYYNFFQIFRLPGITVTGLRIPDDADQQLDYRFDGIESIELLFEDCKTWAVTVWEDHNYISDHLVVHNSLVLEDKMVVESINTDLFFPQTKEQTLVTANLAQMTPIIDRLIMRFTHSPFLKDFLRSNVNRSKGTMDFPLTGGAHYRINARIAGSRGENNMVGLHVPRIKGDEMQLFPMPAYIQLGPTFNSWEQGASQFFCGVPNGLREGSVLYFLDQVSSKFKRYRVPAHQNPYFTLKDNIEALKQYGGEDSEDYQHLVLGRHGTPAYSVIPREAIKLEPYDFYSYRFSGTDKVNKRHYRDALSTPSLSPELAQTKIFAIDTGFTDPTIIQIIGRGKDGIWRTLIRYRLTRIPFPEQVEIINWLDDVYNADRIAIDLGAGGGGIGIMQELISDRFPRTKSYEKRIQGVRFNDQIVSGEDPSGNELKLQVKSYAGQQLAKMVTEHEMVFSEVDNEGISQLERIAYQRTLEGATRYFVLSERGAGASKDDHIFASYVVFIVCLTTMSLQKPVRRLFGAAWI